MAFMTLDATGKAVKRIRMLEFKLLTSRSLREMKEPLEICMSNNPLAVLIPYQQYVEIQVSLVLQRAQAQGLKDIRKVKE
jgi:hypothetical protein